MQSEVAPKRGTRVEAPARFIAIKVFSATTFNTRAALGDVVTRWISDNPSFQVSDVTVVQSSDRAYHCLTMVVFYWELPREVRPALSQAGLR